MRSFVFTVQWKNFSTPTARMYCLASGGIAGVPRVDEDLNNSIIKLEAALRVDHRVCLEKHFPLFPYYSFTEIPMISA